MTANVIPITRPATSREKLIAAVGAVLSREGYEALNTQSVAKEARVQPWLIRRLFGGMCQLVAAYGASEAFWPPAEELLEMGPPLESLSPQEQMAAYFRRVYRALLRRPETLDILGWELTQRTEYGEVLEQARVRKALEFFEHLHGEIPDEIDLSAQVAVMAAAVLQLALRTRTRRFFGGIDLHADAGASRIEEAISRFFSGSLTP